MITGFLALWKSKTLILLAALAAAVKVLLMLNASKKEKIDNLKAAAQMQELKTKDKLARVKFQMEQADEFDDLKETTAALNAKLAELTKEAKK